MPTAALSASCASAEQSSPRLVLPPQRYGVPRKRSATATKSRLLLVQVGEMQSGTKPLSAVTANGGWMRAIASRQPNERPSSGGSFDDGAGEHQRAHAPRRDGSAARPPGRAHRSAASRHSCRRLQLAPRPAFLGAVVDRDALALERFGIEQGVGPRLVPQRRLRRQRTRAACPRRSAWPATRCLRDASRRCRRAPA